MILALFFLAKFCGKRFTGRISCGLIGRNSRPGAHSCWREPTRLLDAVSSAPP